MQIGHRDNKQIFSWMAKYITLVHGLWIGASRSIQHDLEIYFPIWPPNSVNKYMSDTMFLKDGNIVRHFKEPQQVKLGN